MSNRVASSFLLQNSSSSGASGNTNSPPWIYTTEGGHDGRPVVLPSWQVVPFGILAACTSLLTVVGNLIVILSFVLERSIRQTSNYFIASLAVSDLLIGCFSMPLYTVYMLSGQHWTLGEVPCDLWLSLDYTVCLCSIYTVFCITVDRFCSVIVPAKYHRWRTERKVAAIVGVTWTVPVIVFFTSIIGWQYFVRQRTVPDGKCYVQYMDSALFNCLLQVGYFWVTLVVMCGLYAGIYRVALRLHRKSENRRKKMTSLVSMAGQTITNIGIGVTGKEKQQRQHHHQQQQQQLLLQSNRQEAKASTAGLRRPDGIVRTSSEESQDPIIARSEFRNIQTGASKNEPQTAKYQNYLQCSESKDDVSIDANNSSLRDVIFTNHVNKPDQLTDDSLKHSAAGAVGDFNSLHVISNQSAVVEADASLAVCDRWNVGEASSVLRSDDADSGRRQPNSSDFQNSFQTRPEETVGHRVDRGRSTTNSDETRFPPGEEESLESTKEVTFDRSVLFSRFPGDFACSAKSSEELASSEDGEARMRRRRRQAEAYPRSVSISSCVEGARNNGDPSNAVGRRTVGSDESYPLRCMPPPAIARHQSPGKKPLLLLSSLPADLLRYDVETSDKKSWKKNEKSATKVVTVVCRKESTLGAREKPVGSQIDADKTGDNKDGRTHPSTEESPPLFFANTQTSCESDCPPERVQLLAPPPSFLTPAASGGEASSGSVVSVPGGGGDSDDRKRRRSRFMASRKWSSRRRAERRLLAAEAAAARRGDGSEDADGAGDETGDDPLQHASTGGGGGGGQNQMKRKHENRAKKSLRTITLILGAFVICWTPWHVLSLIIGFCPESDCVPPILYDISYWLCYINSPLNPFCYAFANQQFKKTFVRILRLDWHKT